MKILLPALLTCFIAAGIVNATEPEQWSSVSEPLVRVVDLDVGETTSVELCDGRRVHVELLELHETRDPIRQAVRSALVTVAVDGEPIQLESGMYNLPQRVAGVQIDCSVTAGHNSNGTPAFWGLDKAARLRLWPADSPLLRPGSLIYPVDQQWFATRTWFDNEPVDGGDEILPKVYYHSGLDIGGSERQVKVFAATEALVVSVGDEVLEGHRDDTPVEARYDVVYLLDNRGWYYRYSHLDKIHDTIRPGRIIAQGTEIGLLGKQGASGGWSHLHFEIKSRQPSGKWGTQAGYAFLWEAYRRQYQPTLVANARRKSFLTAGEDATLDGSKSWSATDSIQSYDWTFSDGTTANGPRVTRTYRQPGVYSEILKVTDRDGRIDYDFADVHVLDPNQPDQYVPQIHAAYWPTFHNRVHEPITFKVRSFRNQEGNEVWDFGDGSPRVSVKSDGNVDPHAVDGYAITQHTYQQPGDYLVSAERSRSDGVTSTARLHVHVAEEPSIAPANQSWFPRAPGLPPSTDQVIRVATVDALFQAARDVKPGGTILLADGHYMMPQYLELQTDNVTLRSESGHRERVVIDGARSRHGELIGISAATGVTIADLTIQNIKWNGFKINSNSGVQRFRIYNCVIHNIWQRGIKAVAVPIERREELRPKDCRIEYCLFYNDRKKQFSDDPTDTADTFNGNYIGGIDAMYATGWTISDNVFVGIRGRTGAARGAIFVWVDSRDCTIQRNIIIDCDSGICLGNSHRSQDIQVHCTRCVVRNNFVTRAPETGILADYTRDCIIVHNTIHDPGSRLKRLIRIVHDNHGLLVANNLLSGPEMRRENASGKLEIKANVTRVLTDAFVSPGDGDLHLKKAIAGVVDAADPATKVTDDIDRHSRSNPADVGADEFGSSKATGNNGGPDALP